jgi:hypothetical protein
MLRSPGLNERARARRGPRGELACASREQCDPRAPPARRDRRFYFSRWRWLVRRGAVAVVAAAGAEIWGRCRQHPASTRAWTIQSPPLASHRQHDTAVDRSGPKVGEYPVNVIQFRFADLRAHFAVGGKRDCFGEIFAAAHN